MAKYKTSTVGESTQTVEAPVMEAPVEVPAEVAVEAPVETPVETVTVEEAPINEGSFETGVAETTLDAPVQKSWKELLKEADPKEVYAELGLPELDDFDKEFAKFRKAGGDPYQYLAAKAFDWNKVPDSGVIKDELARKYPTFGPEKIDALFNERYKQGEFNTEEEKAAGMLLMEADAYEKRQARIAEQQSFKIPEVQNALAPEIQEQLAAVKQMAEKRAGIENYVKAHNITKQVLESKRVAVDLGDGNVYNFKLDNPQVLQDVLLNNEAASKYGLNEQGEPDLNLAYELAMYKINPAGFKKALFNYGKSVGQQSLIAERQNAVRPTTPVPVTSQNKVVIKGSGTIGS